MQNCHILFRSALLGSTLAVAALIGSAGASESRADLERALAAGGIHSALKGNGIAGHEAGSSFKVLYEFAGQPNDGQDPTAEVTLDKSGNIFGTTSGGGANGTGALFKLTKDGTESLIHSFGGTGDGTTPDGGVVFDASGNMFGTTEYGGASNNGTIWEVSAGGTYSIVHNFSASEGNFIRGRLVPDKNGNLIGTALFGGPNGYGSVFEYSAKGALTVLHGFNNTDGEYPEHSGAEDKSGNFFGVTAFGGTAGEGTVYEIDAKGNFSTLYNFTNGADGGFLYGTVGVDKKGNIYGNTASGGASGAGTVFKLTSNGALTTLYNFTGGTDGGAPQGDVLVVGKNIYGMASTGGDSGCQCGAVFEVSTKGKEKVLHAFTGSDGSGYSAGLTAGGKSLYGTISGGGADGFGTVFSLKVKKK